MRVRSKAGCLGERGVGRVDGERVMRDDGQMWSVLRLELLHGVGQSLCKGRVDFHRYHPCAGFQQS